MAISLDMRVVDSFFNKPAVIRAMDAKTRKAMAKAGAFIRTRARRSLRRRKRASIPPDPPSVHSSSKFHNLKNILFAYNADTQSLVVGPVRTQGGGSSTVPEVHEFGGSITKRTTTRGRRRRRSVRRRHTYRKRPFMGPALIAEVKAGTIPKQWAGPLGSVSAGP